MRQKIAKIVKQFSWIDWLLVGLLGAGLIYLVLFGLSLRKRPLQSVEYLANEAGGGQNSISTEFFVDVSGAVVRPGVYQLPPNARIKDALVAAGGLTDKADREFLAKAVNLAQKIKDGDKIYIPAAGGAGGAGNGTVLAATGELINLNKASLTELVSLNGIGEARGKAIIDHRPYASLDELLTKKVLTRAVLDKIRDKLTIY